MDEPAAPTTLTREEFGAITRAIAEPRRYAMLQQIAAAQELRCTNLDQRDCLSAATISHHLKELQNARLIRLEREGRGLRLSLQREVWAAYLRELSSL